MNFKRIIRWCGLSVAGLAVLLTGLWGALALWYRLPGSATLRDIAAGLMIVLTIAAAISLPSRRRWPAIAIFASVFAGICLWWSTIAPSNDRDWMPDVARNVTGTVNGEVLTVHNLRDFDWRSEVGRYYRTDKSSIERPRQWLTRSIFPESPRASARPSSTTRRSTI